VKRKKIGFLSLVLVLLSGCATQSLGVLPYAEFDKVKKKYPSDRKDAVLISHCDLTSMMSYSLPEELNKLRKQNPGMTGLHDFEIYVNMCQNIRGVVEKGN